MSGGIDSTCVAVWQRPAGALFVNYGQRPADGELIAARAVTDALGIPIEVLPVDCSALGTGILAGSVALSVAPSPEWWPFRNQLLVTLGAAWALLHDFGTVVIGCVKSDSNRHVDAASDFLERLDVLLRMQEGHICLSAPALGLTSAELVAEAGVPASLLGWTHSCHRDAIACGACPGCVKRLETLEEIRAHG